MKSKPKRSNSPDPRGRLGKGILHLLRLAGFALILILLLALFHLFTLGIPAPLTRNLTANLQKNGIPLHIESISLSPHRGWVLHNVRLYSTCADDLKPVFQIEKLYVRAWPSQWIALSQSEWEISLYGKQIDVSLGSPWEAALNETHPFRIIDRLRTHLHIGQDGLSFDSAEVNWGGYILRGEGQIAFPKQKQPANPAFYGSLQTHATRAAEILTDLTFDTPPEISIRFDLPAGSLKDAAINAAFLASGFQRGERLYDRIDGIFSLRDGDAKIDSLQIRLQTGEHLIVSGRYELSSGTTQIELKNTLRSADLLSLFPEHIADKIAQAELQPFGAMEFDAALGPCPPAQLLEQIRVQVHNLQITRNDLTLDPVQFDLIRNGDQLKLSGIDALANGGPLAGDVDLNLSTRAWRTSLQGAVFPDAIGTLVGGGFQTFISRFTFPNSPPNVSVELSHSGVKGSLRLDGEIAGTDFLCAGIPLDRCETSMAYSNRVLVLTDLRADHAGKNFSGDIEIDFAGKLAEFDVINEFPPPQIAQALAPDHPTILNKFSFEGPVYSKGSGQVDYSGGTNHHFDGVFTAEDVSFAGLKADRFDSDISGRNSQLIFSNTSMQIFDGAVEGGATFDLQFTNDASPYRLDIDATELDLAKLFRCFNKQDKGAAKGRLSATLDLTADAAAGFWASAKGQGEVEIEEGQLRDFPILGGFSKLVRTTLPGFSLFSLTTFYSEYELRDGALRSENLQLGGTLFSTRARGKYSPQKGLDFTVRAEPLRQTRKNKKWYQLHLWAADAIKQGTSPLFDLLEFQLEGPLKDPTWRMQALPKEAYELFEKLKFSSEK
ncbi:MAG: hypothetical protein ISR85_03790 [Kiritimatiellales bacterium]|nr:hypothetical protein [Kiritimatiellales bacterium]